MSKVAVHSRHAPAAIGPYSQAIRAGSTAYLSGQIGLDPATVTGDSAEPWCSRYVEWNLNEAYRYAHRFTAVVDYRDFASRYIAVARQWSDLALAADDPEVVATLAFHSRKPGVRFSPTVEAVSATVSPSAAAAYLRWRKRLGGAELGTADS